MESWIYIFFYFILFTHYIIKCFINRTPYVCVCILLFISTTIIIVFKCNNIKYNNFLVYLFCLYTCIV